jgi:hypothetical protein
MAELVERLMGLGPDPQITVHFFESAAAEWATGNITGAQANAMVVAMTGVPLSTAAQTEAQAIVSTVPTGSTAALQAARALKLLEINHVLLLAASRLAPYDTPAAVRTRLGI